MCLASKFFWLEFFLSFDEVECGFVELMSIAPPDVTDFSDYILDNYISEDSQFPPFIWAEEPQTYPRTTNGPESFHSNYNQQFYKQHPNYQNVINLLIEIQTETNLKVNSIGKKITNKLRKETKACTKMLGDIKLKKIY
ncbi:uncharacterized protein LOC111033019 [Myzus persicae]|uniref:uncharacterized protein LOC111033019 n=1 Tax=Myzus persicae TaxID=13164 RepID=UPI000B9330A7|nr:uncharacterized protein LOC111033019 [Myzus persicae]